MKLKREQILFYIALFFMLLNKTILDNSLLADFFPAKVGSCITLICLIVLLIKIICYHKYSRYELAILIGILFMGILSAYYSGNNLILLTCIFLISALDIDTKDMIKFFSVIRLLLTLVVVFLCLNGLVENRIFYRDDGLKRMSLGFNYVNTFSGIVFFSSLGIIYSLKTNKKKYKIIIHTILFILNYFAYKLTNVRTNFLLYLLLIILIFFLKSRYELIKKIFLFMYRHILPGIMMITVFLEYLYHVNRRGTFISMLDSILGYRISIAYHQILNNGLSLIGQKVIMYGVSAIRYGDYENAYYNYIDNAYIQLFFVFGIIPGILFLIMCYKTQLLLIEQNEITACIIFFVLIIQGFISPEFIYIFFNPFLFCMIKLLGTKEYNLMKNINKSNVII